MPARQELIAMVENVKRTFSNTVGKHPLLAAWLFLATGMVAMLLYAARDVELLPSQLAAMVVATILLAGACVWILTWE